MTIKHLFITFAMAIALPWTAYANNRIDSLRVELSRTTSTSDSVRLLYDIMDMSATTDRGEFAQQIYEIAERQGNAHMQLEMLQQLGNVNSRNDSMLVLLEKKCNSIAVDDYQKEISTFLALRRAGCIARFSSNEDRVRRIRQAINEFKMTPLDADIYKQLRNAGTLCILLGNGVHPTFLKEYMSTTLNLMQQLPKTDFAVRNLLLNQAAAVYTNMDMRDEAIDVCRQILAQLDDISSDYESRGRNHRNLDMLRFTTNQCLLQNYESLESDEIEEAWNNILQLAANNPEVAQQMESGLASAFHDMSIGHYAKAIPKLETIVQNTTDNFLRLRCLRQIIKGAEAIGNNDMLLRATTTYNHYLEDYVHSNAQDNYSELQIIYEVNDLQNRNANLRIDQAEAERENHEKILGIVGVGLILLLIVIIVLCVQIVKIRKMSRKLQTANEGLSAESEALRQSQRETEQARDKALKAERVKSEFIENISHEIATPLEAISEYTQLIVDCVETDRKPYLTHYADIVNLNVRLLSALVGDVLDIGTLDRDGKLALNPRPSSLSEILRFVADSMRIHVPEGVNLILESPVLAQGKDVIITTDRERLEQALLIQLDNAVKFTTKGTITLGLTIDDSTNSAVFTVTDTGIGIPDDRRESIFRRFEKLDKQTQGLGLGLSICRMIVDLLGGTVVVDPTYNDGARFITTIPLT